MHLKEKRFKESTGFRQDHPIPVTSCGRRRAFMTTDDVESPMAKRKRSNEPRRTIGRGKNFNKVSKNKSAGGGRFVLDQEVGKAKEV